MSPKSKVQSPKSPGGSEFGVQSSEPSRARPASNSKLKTQNPNLASTSGSRLTPHASRFTLHASRPLPLPFIYLNVAMTADGKLAPANRHFVPFGSKRDRELLLELRSRADAVMSGARTVDLSAVNLGPGPARFRRKRLGRGLLEYNLRVVVSGSGTLDPKAEIFRHRFSPIIILTTERIPKVRLKRLRAVADAVKICGKAEVDFVAACRWLREKWGVKRLLCEGGGEINEGLLRAGLVDEIHVTLCPLILGGRHAPTLADGLGIAHLSDATLLSLQAKTRVGDEIFLVYRLKRRPVTFERGRIRHRRNVENISSPES